MIHFFSIGNIISLKNNKENKIKMQTIQYIKEEGKTGKKKLKKKPNGLHHTSPSIFLCMVMR